MKKIINLEFINPKTKFKNGGKGYDIDRLDHSRYQQISEIYIQIKIHKP